MHLGFDSMALQHSTPYVGEDTFRDNSAKNKSTYRILVTQNLSVVSKMEFYVFVLSCVCYVFVRVCLYVLCGHLLGKG